PVRGELLGELGREGETAHRDAVVLLQMATGHVSFLRRTKAPTIPFWPRNSTPERDFDALYDQVRAGGRAVEEDLLDEDRPAAREDGDAPALHDLAHATDDAADPAVVLGEDARPRHDAGLAVELRRRPGPGRRERAHEVVDLSRAPGPVEHA